MDDTPRSLLDRLRGPSDAASWKRLVDLYTPFLRRSLMAQRVPDCDVDDLLQEVFSVLTAEMPRFQHSGRPGAFRHWLRGVLNNRVRRYWQQRQRVQQQRQGGGGAAVVLQEVEDPENALERLWDREHNQWITQRLVELIEPEFTLSTWQAFHRLVIDSARSREVAAELGLSVNAVLIAKSRVLRRMRQELKGLTD